MFCAKCSDKSRSHAGYRTACFIRAENMAIQACMKGREQRFSQFTHGLAVRFRIPHKISSLHTLELIKSS